MKNKWIKKEGSALVSAVESPKDVTRELLQEAVSTKKISDTKALADFKKRKLVTIKKVFTYNVRKGPKYAKEMPIEHTDLTADMLMSGDWKTANFKPYNFKALGASPNAGALHPLNKVRKEFRDIFFHLGFVEMPTSRSACKSRCQCQLHS
jgi:phenylalanyl-tRNA synthetase alpha chain